MNVLRAFIKQEIKMDNLITDANSEFDLSESWTVVNNVPGQDTQDSTPNAETSDDDSLEVMHVEGEDKSTNNDADTDGISVISESDGCSDAEIVQAESTVINTISKERKYVHRPNPYINMWLSILMAMSLAATLGLGIGHYLGTQKYLVAREVIHDLQQENVDLGRQLDDVSLQHYQCRKDLDITKKQSDAQLGHCSISDALHCRDGYCNIDELRGKFSSKDSNAVCPNKDSLSEENGRDESDITNNQISEKQQNPQYVIIKNNTKKILTVQSENVLDGMKELPDEIKLQLSEGHDLVSKLKEKLLHLSSALKSWKKIISQELSVPSYKTGKSQIKLPATENKAAAELYSVHAMSTAERKFGPKEEDDNVELSFSNLWRKVCNNSLKTRAVSLLSSALHKFNSKFNRDNKLEDTEISDCESGTGSVNSQNPVFGSLDKDTAPESDNNINHLTPTDDISVSSFHYFLEALLKDLSLNVKDQQDKVEMSVNARTRNHVQGVQDISPKVYDTHNNDNVGQDFYHDNHEGYYGKDIHDVHDDDDDTDDHDDYEDYGDYKYYNKYKHDKYEKNKRKKHYKNEKHFGKGKQNIVHKRDDAENNFRKYIHAKPRYQHKIRFQNKRKEFSHKPHTEKPRNKHKFVDSHQTRNSHDKKGNKKERIPWNSERLSSNRNRSGLWLMKLYEGRAEHRENAEKNDWFFKRAMSRKDKRDEENRSEWYFSRGQTREICRLHQRPDWCKFYDQEDLDNFQSGKNRKWSNDHRNQNKFHDQEDTYWTDKRKWNENHRNRNNNKFGKYEAREEDFSGYSKYAKGWKLRNLPKYFRSGKIISEALLSAAKFFKS